MVICLERDADLHMAQLMPLPLTVCCCSKIQIGFTFLVPAHLGSPGQRAVKRVCVCMYVSYHQQSAVFAGHHHEACLLDTCLLCVTFSGPSHNYTLMVNVYCAVAVIRGKPVFICIKRSTHTPV